MTRSTLAAFGAVLLALSVGSTISGQPPRRPPAGQPGPWDNDVLVFHVDAQGRSRQIASFSRAGVSTLVRMPDGRLIVGHQHFPADNDADFDKVAVRFSSDDGRDWSRPEVIRLHGLPDGMRFPFDPTLVPLPDGRVRLYFTSLLGRQFNQAVPAIYSAISTGGIEYTVEPGQRFGIDGRPVIDCAVVLHKGVFHLYAPDNGRMPAPARGLPPPIGLSAPEGAGYHATSHDGLTFTRVDDVRVPGRRRWLGAAYSDGRTMAFFGTGEPGVWSAMSDDGASWRVGDGFAIGGADPGAVPAKDGGWILSVTGPPRNGAGGRR